MNQHGPKVLVLMTSPLDMIVHALRALDTFSRELPQARFTWVVREVFEPLVSCFPAVEDTIVFYRRGGLNETLALVRKIRRDRYDFVLDFEGHARTGLMTWLARSRRKIGRAAAREGATVFYRELVPPPTGGSEHVLDGLLEFGGVFGLRPQAARFLERPLGVAAPAVWHASASGRRVCIFPGRYKSTRAWPRFGELVKEILEAHADVTIYLLGLEMAMAQSNLISADSLDRVVDLRGQASWPEVVCMLAEADLTVANDNGPAQLAGALGRPNLTLYTFVHPEHRGSYPVKSSGNDVLVAEEGDVRRLAVTQVFAAVEKLLAV